MTKVTLNRKISQRVANGHPWVFANEVNRVEGNAEAGAIVDVHTHDDIQVIRTPNMLPKISQGITTVIVVITISRQLK